MKKAMQQLAWAIIFGLGLPGLILAVTAEANRRAEDFDGPGSETTAWTAPMEATDVEVSPQ